MPSDHLKWADEAIGQAIALMPDNGMAHDTKGKIRRAQKRHEEAIAAEERAIGLNPNNAVAYAEIGVNRLFLGQPERTAEYVQQAIQLSPRDPFLVYWLLYIGVAQLHLGQDEEALGSFRRAIDADPGFPNSYGWIAAAYVFTGREAEAHPFMDVWRRASPTLTLGQYKAQEQSDHPAFRAQRQRIYDAWRKLGLPE